MFQFLIVYLTASDFTNFPFLKKEIYLYFTAMGNKF